MFKKVASDALGLSDIGQVISPADYGKVESDDYVMHEEGEKIFFLIKSRMDEYCFTNMALIHVDGTSAVSKKRMLYRYDYYKVPISNVRLETAGTMDRDIEIKFQLGDKAYSIDVDKRQLEQLKDLYKALIRIGSLQQENRRLMQYAETSLQTAAQSLPRTTNDSPPSDQFKAINEYSFSWLQQSYKKFSHKDYSAVFEKFINN